VLDRLAVIEQPAQLPVAVVDGRQQNGVFLILRVQGGGGGDVFIRPAEDFAGLAVLHQPLRPLAAGILMGQVLQQIRAHAQQPVAIDGATGLAQQQIDDAGVTVIAEVIALGAAARRAVPDPVRQVGGIGAGAKAVEQDFAFRADQCQALQGGQGLAQLLDQGLLLAHGFRRLVHRQQIEGGFSAQGHAQANVVGQVGTVIDAGLALLLQGFLELFDQQPEQHGQQQ